MFDLEIVVDAQLPPYHLLVTLGIADPTEPTAIPLTVTVSRHADARIFAALAPTIADAVAAAVAGAPPEAAPSVRDLATRMWLDEGGRVPDQTSESEEPS